LNVSRGIDDAAVDLVMEGGCTAFAFTLSKGFDQSPQVLPKTETLAVKVVFVSQAAWNGAFGPIGSSHVVGQRSPTGISVLRQKQQGPSKLKHGCGP
jgi:hypothetical protein